MNFELVYNFHIDKIMAPVNVELVKILTILELTGGKDSKEPANIKSTVRSSILNVYFLTFSICFAFNYFI